ncbi:MULTISPECIES: helix-turn-helix domain-containing protein [Pseudomonas syringae group]|uniref:helix-turn-helix domain-containing protein n=2 Tax=Pseudomonas TaxID=286 RepID=UPI00070E8AD5|nr:MULTISPECIES: helix-turn-helix transcriptional regulator [Pseudomonas syringae group]KWS23301.1 Fis family transcriptional regulator [Pseudomonas amygdali pv. ulmi]POP66105.1 XRE family transcriptional regulator [Pseudomonas syringae]
MEYLEAVGYVLREIRVDAGLRREDCLRAMSREYLASVERGRQAISIAKLRSLCECLGVAPSLVLFAAEAHLASLELGEYQASQERQIQEYVATRKLSNEAGASARQGVRGRQAEKNRKAVQYLRSEGLTKAEVARKLGIGKTTVDRHWHTPEGEN